MKIINNHLVQKPLFILNKFTLIKIFKNLKILTTYQNIKQQK